MRGRFCFSFFRNWAGPILLLTLIIHGGSGADASPGTFSGEDFLLVTDSDFDIETWRSADDPGGGPAPAILMVESRPSGAAVYLNQSYAGMTPLTLRDLPPGGYQVSLQRKTYRDAAVYLSLDSGRTARIFGRLRSETGSLRVIPIPADAEVYVDGNRIWTDEDYFSVGSHSLLVRRFGYQDFSAQIWISADQTSEVQARLLPADFAVEDFRLSRRRLNPNNPGLTGRADLGFTVTAPGSGQLMIYDQGGQLVRSHTFPPFNTWKQGFRWDGRDDGGQALPDGGYQVRISLESAGGGVRTSLEEEIQLDRNLLIRYRSLHHGQPGLLYAPLAFSLPPGSFQLSSTLTGEAGRPGGDDGGRRYIALLGLAAGISPGLELSPLVSLSPRQKEGSPRMEASLGLKQLLRGSSSGPLSLSSTLGLHLSNQPTYSGLSRFPGLSAGAVMGLRSGALGFTAAPEVLVSPLRISSSGGWEKADGIDGALLSRFGVFWESSSLLTGISTVLATGAGRDAPRLLYPVHSGIEIHGLLPETLVFLTASLSWEYSPGEQRFFLGAGLGLVY